MPGLVPTLLSLVLGLAPNSWAQAPLANWLNLDGVNDSAACSNSSDLALAEPSSLTVEAWFQADNTEPYPMQRRPLVVKRGAWSLSVDFEASYMGGYDCIAFSLYTDDNSLTGSAYCLGFLNTGWHHVAMVLDNPGNLLNLYLDGQLRNSIAQPAVLRDSTHGVEIGHAVYSSYTWDGRVEEVRISNAVRYSGTTYAVPSAAFACDGSTVALWHFDECNGATTLYDGGDGAGSQCGTVEDTLFGVNGAQTGGPACSFSIDPISAGYPPGGGSGSVDVTAPPCCAWTAISNDAWITVTSGSSGSGAGAVTYSVATNGSSSGRTGTISIAGQTFTVNQAGISCSYSIDPTSQAFGSGAGTGGVDVTAPAGCPWSALANAPWITVTSGASGAGNGSVGYSVAANTSGLPRASTMTIAGLTFTIDQDGVGCAYSIAPASAVYLATGGSGSVAVDASSGCPWTATEIASWLTVTSGSSGNGPGTVSYSVAANIALASRSAPISIAGLAYQISQHGTDGNNPPNTPASPAPPDGAIDVSTTPTLSWTGGDPDTGGLWVATGSLSEARGYFAGDLLADGRVLVSGGMGLAVNGSATAEVYDPTCACWLPTGSMNQARLMHTATRLASGPVLVAGGQANSVALQNSELYNPASGTWSYTGSMNQSRITHSATLLPNGKVLVAGGCCMPGVRQTAELYDPTSGTWAFTGSMNVPRGQHTATLLPNGLVLVAGGTNGSTSTAVTELYNPATGVFTATGSLNVARHWHIASLLGDGRVLVAGGCGGGCVNALHDSEIYDPQSGVWTETAWMPIEGYLATAARLHDDTVVVAGGTWWYYSQIFQASPASWSWQYMVYFHQTHIGALLTNGRYLVAGGNQMQSEFFDPPGDTVSYDVLLGTSDPPPLVASGLSTRSFSPVALVPGATYLWKVIAHDNLGASAEGATWQFRTACPAIDLTPASPLPVGVVGAAYTQQFSGSGGAEPYTFTISDGSLPATLILGSGGLLGGIPGAIGIYSFTVTAMDANGCQGSRAYTLAVTALADLSLTKGDSPDPVDAGAAITYTLMATNGGPSVANSLTVTDTLPNSVTFVSVGGAGWACGQSSGIVTCTRPFLAVGVAPSITVVVTAPPAGGPITNYATVTAEESDPNSGNNAASAETTVTSVADLSVSKGDDPDPVDAGETVVYTLDAASTGPSTATGLVVTDTLPAGVGFVSAAGPGWACGQGIGVVTCTRPSLAVGAAPAITIQVTAPVEGGGITNNAGIAASESDPNAGNNAASAQTTVVPIADLSLAKGDSPDPVDAGGTVVYTLNAASAGPSTATGLVVTDTLPVGVGFVSASGTGWACGQGSGVVTCTRPSLAVGAAPAITIQVTAPVEGGGITNNAGIAASESDPNAGNNAASAQTTVVPIADLSLAKGDSPDPVDAGGTVVYTLNAANAGPSTATDLAVTDTLPAGVGFVSAAGTGWACGQASGVVTCTRPALAVGAAPVISIQVTAPVAGGTLTNNASITATESDPNSTNNSATAETSVTARADLVLTKADSPDPVPAGASLVYTLSVSNGGESSATDLVLTDTLPAEVAFVSASGTGWSCGHVAGTVTCTRPALGVGPATDIFIEVTAPSTCCAIVNEATVTAVEIDPQPANNTASATTTIDLPPTVVVVDCVRPTADGTLEEGEGTDRSITQLLLVFSEAMADPPGNSDSGDVTNPANFPLLEAGANAIFDTAPCGTTTGDDQAIAIAAVAYYPGLQRALLTFGTTFSLPAGSYRLSACGTLTDSAGSALDGDGDGQGGDSFNRSFWALETNLLANPNLDTDLAGWTATSPLPGEIQWGVADADSAPTSGSAEVMTAAGVAQTFELAQCVVTASGGRFRAAGAGRIASGSAEAPTLRLKAESFVGPLCEGSALAIATSPVIAGDTAGSWSPTELPAVTMLASGSLRLMFEAQGGSAASFTIDLDDAELLRVPPLFADGFESGDTSAWSSTIP